MTLKLITKKDIRNIIPLLEQRDAHYYQVNKFIQSPMTAEYIADLEKFILIGEIHGVFTGGRCSGFIGFRKREWDTNHFGYPVSSIDYFYVEQGEEGNKTALLLVNKFDQWAKDNSIKFASIKAYPDQKIMIALQKKKFYYLEDEFILAKTLPDLNLGSADANIRHFKESDLEELLEIVKAAPWINRFVLDPRIDKKKGLSVYVDWLANGIKRKNCQVAVLEQENKPVGFILWSFKKSGKDSDFLAGDQELVAINPNIRGHGFGKILYHGTLTQMQDFGISFVKTVISVANAPALYNQFRLGFRILSNVITFHKFFD